MSLSQEKNKAKRILVLEDEQELSESINLIMTMAGYSVSTALSGDIAYKMISGCHKVGNSFDLLITDIQLPGISGIELIDKVKDGGVDLPFIAISGFGDSDMLVNLEQRGCFGFLGKPFTPRDLTDLTKKFFSGIGDVGILVNR